MSHWDRYNNWNYVEAPLKPAPVTVDLFYALMDNPKSILMLGCTRELVSLNCDKIVAIDKSQSRIDKWFIKSNKVYGIKGNWLNLSNYVKGSTFDYIIGDGSFICLPITEQKIVIAECKKVLNPGGKIIIRAYETPISETTLSSIKRDLTWGEIKNFSSLKLKLYFYVSCCGSIGVPVANVRTVFYSFFDKQQLSENMKWPLSYIDVIDTYEKSSDIYYVPTRDMIEKAFPNIVIVESYGYPMAEHCPFYIFT